MVEVVVSRHVTIKTTLFVLNLIFNTHRVCAICDGLYWKPANLCICGPFRFFSFGYIPS